MAGVALGDIDLHFAWHACHLWHWAGSGDALGSRWAPWSPRHFVVAGVALGDIDLTYGTGLVLVTRLGPGGRRGRRGTLRGRRGTW